MASTQEVEMLRRQLDELTAQMIEVRQQSSSTAMNAAVTGLAEAVRTMGQSVSKPRPEDMRVGKPEPYAPGKDFDDWDFTFNGYAGTLDPASPALLKTARQLPTVVMATPPHEQQSATLLYLLTMLTQKGARKVVRKAGNNGFVEAVHGHIHSHDATRHKLRRTLAYSCQQFHLPFHLQFVSLDLFSQDSQCDPTAEHHSNICLELHMYHLCACLVNRYSL